MKFTTKLTRKTVGQVIQIVYKFANTGGMFVTEVIYYASGNVRTTWVKNPTIMNKFFYTKSGENVFHLRLNAVESKVIITDLMRRKIFE